MDTATGVCGAQFDRCHRALFAVRVNVQLLIGAQRALRVDIALVEIVVSGGTVNDWSTRK